MSINLTGACHCRSVRVRFQLSKAPGDLRITTCPCGFCRRHGPRMTADPGGRLEIRSDLGAMLRYKFETRSADYILCSRCASYVAQVSEHPDGARYALVNVNCLDDQEAFKQPSAPLEPMVETLSQKREQRARSWTPCTFSSSSTDLLRSLADVRSGDLSGEWIHIGSSKVQTWRVAPRDARRGGVVVLQEIFGISSHIRAICDSFAEHGYEALAPAIFRADPDFVAEDVNDNTIAVGRALVESTPLDGAMADCQALVDWLTPKGPVFMAGFCYGGSLAWLAAQRLSGIAAISSFYGRFAPDHLDAPLRAPTICHFGKTDTSIPLDRVEKLAAAYPDTPVYLYEAGHGFMRAGDHYHVDSAKLAWLRTLQLFQRNSGARTDA